MYEQGITYAFITTNFTSREGILQQHSYPAIEAYVSQARLKTYIALTNNASLGECIGAYVWNKRVGAALFPLLQCLEVTLRNGVNNAASAHFGTPAWFDSLTKLAGHDYYHAFIAQYPHLVNNFYRKGVSTGSRKNKKIWTSRHESMLYQAKDKLSKASKPLHADAIVAELMLGFWVGMFEKNYHDLNNANRLWPHLEPVVFPNLLPSERRHGEVHKKLIPIKALRNRVAHHEPIWKHATVGNSVTAIKMLTQIIDDIVFIINGISRERAEMLHESGIEGAARAICRKESLDFYLAGRVSKEISLRRLKRNVLRHIDGKSLFPFSYNNAGKETVILNLNM
ncbi:TPA: Abi family protein [Kluyvera cryocrescens]|nr:Abi family protein [Kluyvera cryocrescens]